MEGTTLMVTGRLQVRPDRRDAALAAALALAEASRTEPGCLEFRVCSDAADPYLIVFFEQWSGVDTMTRNFQTFHMTQFRESAKQFAVGELEVKRYVVTPVSPSVSQIAS
jgi:quinol monooxygenase YgiN